MSALKSLRLSVVLRDRFPVDERPIHRQTANRLGDPKESLGEVRAASAPDLRALAQLVDKNPETVCLTSCSQPGPAGSR